MITLGIETSCDETAVCLLKDKKVLADEVASSWKRHADLGGVVPEIASRSHLEAIIPCLDRVLTRSRIALSQVDLIAVTQGPGLMGSLLVGGTVADSLSRVYRKPVVGVDHVLAHAFSGQLMKKKNTYPFLGLVVSGGHTLIIHWKRLGEFRVIGNTQDDAAGEAFDKVAKMLDLGYPGGPVVDRLGRQGNAARFAFPRPMIQDDNFSFSFSGLKTAVYYQLKELVKQNAKITDADKADIAASFQEAVVETLVVKSLKAGFKTRSAMIVVGGGVSANSRLRERLMEFQGKTRPAMRSHPWVTRHRIELLPKREIIFPAFSLCLDNAVMIAALGRELYLARKRKPAGPASKPLKVYSDFFVAKDGRAVYNKR